MRSISKAEGYDVVYQASSAINFAGFDYKTVKQSLVDYIKLYHPESFTDFIESSELIAIIESFAYVCELLAYRFDMNAHENTIEFAQRKDMVIRLARMVSYNATRVTPSSGLVKLESISTTEKMVDSRGKQLSNQVIKWNDVTNSDWKEQFFLVFNKISQQPYGSVDPDKRVSVGSVLFETYALNVNVGELGVIPITISINNATVNYEIVSTEINEYGPYESRPEVGANFKLVYGDDGLGDDSSYTGVFMMIKQGTLYKTSHIMSNVTPNQSIVVSKPNVNNTDVWLNQITSDGTIYWNDITSQDANTAYNLADGNLTYYTETLSDDMIRLTFGDDDFSQNPNGNFNLWYRSSDPQPTYIPRTSLQKRSGSFNYVDYTGRIQTITFTYSLTESIQNGSSTETIDHIRINAPRVYATQDRMVSASDHNDFPLSDPSIKKLRTVNRTFAGDSLAKLISDPSGTYQDIKMYNSDGWLYEDDTLNLSTESVTRTPEYVIQNTLTPVLSLVETIQYAVVIKNIPVTNWRLAFNTIENSELVSAFYQITSPWPLGMYFDGNGWILVRNDTTNDWDILVNKNSNEYTITSKGSKLVFESNGMNFYQDNQGEKVYTIQSAQTKTDNLRLLKANILNVNGGTIFPTEVNYVVLGLDTIVSGLYSNGLVNNHKLILTTYDQSGELVPDNISQRSIYDSVVNITTTIPNQQVPVDRYTLGMGDVSGNNVVEPSYTIVSNSGNTAQLNLNGLEIPLSGSFITNGSIWYRIQTVNVVSASLVNVTFYTTLSTAQGDTSLNVSVDFSSAVNGSNWTPYQQLCDWVYVTTPSTTTITVKSYVYQQLVDDVYVSSGSISVVNEWILSDSKINIRRVRGRGQFNFMWTHRIESTNLVNPSPTNIHDMFVITENYYSNVVKWLNGELTYRPTPPTANALAGTYKNILSKKMMSDTIILVSGKIKILFGQNASAELRAKFSVVRSPTTKMTDNNIKREIVSIINGFFDVDSWELGESFYFTELESLIYTKMQPNILSINLIPLYTDFTFGDLLQIDAREDEILMGFIQDSDVEIVSTVTPASLGR